MEAVREPFRECQIVFRFVFVEENVKVVYLKTLIKKSFIEKFNNYFFLTFN